MGRLQSLNYASRRTRVARAPPEPADPEKIAGSRQNPEGWSRSRALIPDRRHLENTQMAKKQHKSKKPKKSGGRGKLVILALGLGGALSAAAWYLEPELVQSQVDRVRNIIGI